MVFQYRFSHKEFSAQNIFASPNIEMKKKTEREKKKPSTPLSFFFSFYYFGLLFGCDVRCETPRNKMMNKTLSRRRSTSAATSINKIIIDSNNPWEIWSWWERRRKKWVDRFDQLTKMKGSSFGFHFFSRLYLVLWLQAQSLNASCTGS